MLAWILNFENLWCLRSNILKRQILDKKLKLRSTYEVVDQKIICILASSLCWPIICQLLKTPANLFYQLMAQGLNDDFVLCQMPMGWFMSCLPILQPIGCSTACWLTYVIFYQAVVLIWDYRKTAIHM